MLNALLIANARSGTSHKLTDQDLPGRWIADPAAVTADDVRSADLIALMAGDGTLQKTLSQILREIPATELPPIAVLPFGTTNMNSKALNRTQSRRSTLINLDLAIRTGTFGSQMRSLVRVEQAGVVQHGFFFGAGVIAQVVEQWNKERDSGALTNQTVNQARTLWAMLRGLSSISSETAMAIDGSPNVLYGLLASTLEKLLFGCTPYWCECQPGDLRLTWVESNAPGLLRHAPALLRGKLRMAGVPGYHSSVAERVQLDFDGSYIIDGEIFHTANQPLTVSRSDPICWLTL